METTRQEADRARREQRLRANLRRGILVEFRDVHLLQEHLWSLRADGYAMRSSRGRTTYLHRAVMGAPGGVEVDHINRRRRDNRRRNLRMATTAENCQNRSRYSNRGTSRYKGVSWDKSRGAWRAQIKVRGRKCALGLYDSEIEAARAYDAAALRSFGEFAATNVDLGLLPPPGRAEGDAA